MTQSGITQFAALAALAFSPLLYGQATPSPLDGHFETSFILSNPCAVTTYQQSDGSTRIVYGDIVSLSVKGTVERKWDITSKGEIKYKYAISVHGDGTGSSGAGYVFNSKAYVKADVSLGSFDGKFKMVARLIPQGNATSSGGLAQGAQDNALLRFYVNIRFDKGMLQAWGSDYTLECTGSPWTNLMEAPYSVTKTPVGRGFGDPWNKYAWSMKDFNGGMLVATKNAYYDYFATQNPTEAFQACRSNPVVVLLPSLYRDLACLELTGTNSLNMPAAYTAFAEIWRFDYSKKDWTRVVDDYRSQGYRIMAMHKGQLYVGSDLGSFITGITFGSGKIDQTGPTWSFPGSELLRSGDGVNFTSVPCPPPPSGPCSFAIDSPLSTTGPDVNVSFRALASYGGKLYLGTFNFAGGELWVYDDTNATTPWAHIFKANGQDGIPPSAGITELAVYKDKLYIGLFGQLMQPYHYLLAYDGVGIQDVIAGRKPGVEFGSFEAVCR